MLIATTTVSIVRPDGSGDPYEAATATAVATSVQAHVSAPSGADSAVGGDKEVIDATVFLPTGTTIERADIIVDDADGTNYAVVWSRARSGLGLDHVVVGVRTVAGGASG